MKNQTLDNSSFQQQLLQNVIVYGKPILYSIAGLMIFGLGIYLYAFKSNASQEVNYLRVEKSFHEFLLDPTTINSSKLIAMLKEDPKLVQKYQAKFAQRLMIENDWSNSIPFAVSSIENNKGFQLVPFDEFSKATFAIGEGKLETALAISENLKNQLNSEDADLKQLYANNLLRIAFLQKALHHSTKEIVAWKEYQATTPVNVQKIFQLGEISLNDYIAYRESIISGNL